MTYLSRFSAEIPPSQFLPAAPCGVMAGSVGGSCDVHVDCAEWILQTLQHPGQDYRSLNLKVKLPTLSEAEAISFLATNGNLIKRPFLISADTILVGFKADVWSVDLTT